MKKLIEKGVLMAAIVLLSAGFASCEDEATGGEQSSEELYKAVLKEYVNSTVVPTYKHLAESALEMRTANNALKANKTDATMTAAADAWMKARVAWEMNESFLFGPVGDDAFGVDGHIDSWPLELEDIQGKLTEIEKNPAGFTGRDAWKLEGNVIGFHVAEYLLYRDGKVRTAAAMTDAELSYLMATTDAMVWDCLLAYVAWVGVDHVSSEMEAVFNENPDVVEHFNKDNGLAYHNFKDKIMNATGGYQGSYAASMGEIPGGASEIAGEVGSQKIEAPYRTHSVEDVESWYSWHSLDDYQNNILSVKNAYLGGMDDQTRTSVSLSTFVALKDAALDAKLKEKIADCLAKIKAIGKDGKSFYEVVRDQSNKAEVDAAVLACTELESLFNQSKDLIK